MELQRKDLFQNHLGSVDFHWPVDNLRHPKNIKLTW
jgi:hypothetical protein